MVTAHPQGSQPLSGQGQSAVIQQRYEGKPRGSQIQRGRMKVHLPTLTAQFPGHDQKPLDLATRDAFAHSTCTTESDTESTVKPLTQLYLTPRLQDPQEPRLYREVHKGRLADLLF